MLTPERKRPPYAGLTLYERFMLRVVVTDAECWQWTGGGDDKGYGQFYAGGEKPIVKAHRWLYEYTNGPIPRHLQLDHLCRNRRCVNPAHLEVVTNRENALRGNGACGMNARKTHCTNGHAFSDDNTLIDKHGHRRCRTCDRAKSARYYQRKANAHAN